MKKLFKPVGILHDYGSIKQAFVTKFTNLGIEQPYLERVDRNWRSIGKSINQPGGR